MWARSIRLVGIVLLILAAGRAEASDKRTWTDTNGNHIEAKFVRYFNGFVVLQRGTRVLRVAFASLSPEDQQYVRQQLEKEGKAHLLPPAAPVARSNRGTMPDLRPAGQTDEQEERFLAMPEESAEYQGQEQPPGSKTSAASQEVERIWTDIRGNRVRGTLVGVEGQKVYLRINGQVRAFPIFGFSSIDQDYIRQRAPALAVGSNRDRSDDGEGLGSIFDPGFLLGPFPNPSALEELADEEQYEQYDDYETL